MPVPQPNAVDAHTHLDFPCFDDDRDEVIRRARAAGVGSWVIAGADPQHWDRVVTVARQTGGVAAAGVHPWWALEQPDADPASVKGIVAIGEIGLDWYRARTDDERAVHRRVFRRQLATARDLDLPVVLHCVRAMPELLRTLRQDGLPTAGGMIHAWSGPEELVDDAVSLGLMLSFGATVTRSRRVANAARRCPTDNLLIETDAPDQPLDKGTRGEPAHLTRVADAVARLRDTNTHQVLACTAANARRLLPLPEAS